MQKQVIVYPSVTDWKIIFGDRCMARLKSMAVLESENKIRFIFVPDPYMSWKYQIQNDEYDQVNWFIVKDYPRDYCHCPIPDPKFQTWEVLCDYNGNMCDPFHQMNHELIVQNNALRAERNSLKKMLSLLPLSYNKMISHQDEIRSKIIREVREEAKAVTISLGNEEKKEGEK